MFACVSLRVRCAGSATTDELPAALWTPLRIAARMMNPAGHNATIVAPAGPSVQHCRHIDATRRLDRQIRQACGCSFGRHLLSAFIADHVLAPLAGHSQIAVTCTKGPEAAEIAAIARTDRVPQRVLLQRLSASLLLLLSAQDTLKGPA